MSKKLYRKIAVGIDLVSYEYKTSNPIIIAEKLQEDLGMNYTIHQISDYLDINRLEDYEYESRRMSELFRGEAVYES
jgi:hypothetical protein